MKLAFWGKTIEVTLNSSAMINLFNKKKGINENYEVNFPKNSVNNLIFGKAMNFNHWGDIVCWKIETDDKCIVKVNAVTGMFLKEKDKAKFNGHVFEKGAGAPKYRISGSWLTDIKIAKFESEKNDFGEDTVVY